MTSSKGSQPTRAPKVAVHAHRGGAALAPENTMAAFRAAVGLGVHYIELDVRLCATGELVVVHDETLERVASVPRKPSSLSLAELQALDVGSHFDSSYASEGVPSLEEVLDELSASVRFNIEIKEEALSGDGTSSELARLLSSMDLAGRCIVSSFNPASLRRLSSACCVPTGLLYPTDGAGGIKDRLTRKPWFAPLLPIYALHPHQDQVDAELVRRAHLRGLAVNTWTVNDPARMKQLLELGVNGLITDRPDLALELVAELDSAEPGQ